jgi:hypothetical protein
VLDYITLQDDTRSLQYQVNMKIIPYPLLSVLRLGTYTALVRMKQFWTQISYYKANWSEATRKAWRYIVSEKKNPRHKEYDRNERRR